MDTKQDWKGLDGAIAWHFIERQAENWNQVGEMMNEWLKANTPTKEWAGLTDEDLENIKLLTFEKEINSDGEEQEAVDLDHLMRATEQLCKERNT